MRAIARPVGTGGAAGDCAAAVVVVAVATVEGIVAMALWPTAFTVVAVEFDVVEVDTAGTTVVAVTAVVLGETVVVVDVVVEVVVVGAAAT